MKVDALIRWHPARLSAVFALLSAMLAAAPDPASAQTSKMSRVTVNEKKYTGEILHRDSQSLTLLRRDGTLARYNALKIDRVLDLNEPFSAYTTEELERRLLLEFSRGYTVRCTEHFAVVYPSESTFAWSREFESLFRSFQRYFETRGFELRLSGFPMIAVVFRTRAEFERVLSKTELTDQKSVVGFYSIQSNRIFTFDQATSDESASQIQPNLTTIIHEATHQSAFNSGIHDRFRPVPRWVTEGLATMFEAKGVYNCIDFPAKQDRIAMEYFEPVQALIAAGEFRGKIKSLISGDRLFDEDPASAYPVAWALTFFLAENRPEQYREYLRATVNHKRFVSVNAQQRLDDFCGVFGNELRDLESRMIRFYGELEPAKKQ
jgi:hypothetical protein